MPIYVISTVPCNRGTPAPQSGDGWGIKKGPEMVKVLGGPWIDERLVTKVQGPGDPSDIPQSSYILSDQQHLVILVSFSLPNFFFQHGKLFYIRLISDCPISSHHFKIISCLPSRYQNSSAVNHTLFFFF